MCVSSLVPSPRPKIFKKRPQPLKNPLTPIGSCRDLHISPLTPHSYRLKAGPMYPSPLSADAGIAGSIASAP